MIKGFKKHAIVLDTNSFGKATKYNFKKSGITICLGALRGYSNIDVFLPSIVYEELKKHIREVIFSIIESINSSFINNHIDTKTIEDVYTKKIEELDIFIEEYNVKIIDCNKLSDMDMISQWYFNCEKPFSKAKPKEFPDAMIVSSILSFFKDKDIYDSISVISNDNDVCDAIKKYSKYQVYCNIQNVCENLIGFSEKEYRKCESYIKEKGILSIEETYSIESYDINDEYEIDEIDYSINRMDIIDKNEESKYIQLCVNCDLILNGSFYFVDYDLSVYDSKDPECSVYWYRKGDSLSISDISVFISIYYDDKGNFINYEIDDVFEINLKDYIYQLDLNE